MTETVHTTLQTDHRTAAREHDQWLENIGRWRVAHRKALAMLATMQSRILEWETAILELDTILEEHANHIRAHETHIQQHELEITGHEPQGKHADHDRLLIAHEDFETVHAQSREAHDSFKIRHEAMIGEIVRLLEAFDGLTKSPHYPLEM